MSTATLSAPTPVDVLNHKKRFAEVLSSRDAVRTSADAALSKVRGIGRSARETAASIFRALHIDALAGSVGNTVRGLFGRGWALVSQAWAFIGRTFGWKTVAVYLITDPSLRARGINAAISGYFALSVGAVKLATQMRRVPLVGSLLVSLLTPPAKLIDRAVVKGFGLTAIAVEKYGNHWIANMLHGFAQFLLFRSAVTRFVPGGLRLPLIIGYGMRELWTPATQAIEAVKADPLVDTFAEQAARVKGTAKSAFVVGTDAVVDRVLDGPKGDIKTTQPGVERLDITVVATGQRAVLEVTVDTRGQKWVTWDGVNYAVDDLPDEIAPLPVDLSTLALKADQARKAAQEVMPPPPNLATAQHPRDVARALGPKSKKAPSRAKASPHSAR